MEYLERGTLYYTFMISMSLNLMLLSDVTINWDCEWQCFYCICMLWLAAIDCDAVENVTKLASLGQVLPRAPPPPQQPRGRRNISASEFSTWHIRGELVILTAAAAADDDDTDLTSWRWWHETRRRNIVYNCSHIQCWKCIKGLLTACGPVLACLMSPLSPPPVWW